ncbi:tyrosine-protein phosphatase [Limnoglobus roseus]|uniref:Tyrosine specific protein phosphatases domain-containing protein n=1 Tax=Limnoglobus roseus TaxID=2598579 RepID=A0A5C1AE73_9BACT|nr:tyrosine-protein phosphatase [Limnoglobus roseus]QEL15424.1 hypothetical protein PX52LOC_02343 [Limnoglobus roseus]
MLRDLIRCRFTKLAVRRPSWRTVRRTVVGVGLLLVGLEVFRVVAWTNKHELLPGKVYRTAQLNEDGLREFIEAKGIKTVINLRGFCPGPEAPWYAAEVRTTQDLGVSQEDVTLSANRLPPPVELRRLIEILDRAEYPITFHCKRGADRTGLTATVVMLLFTDASLDRARRQLWPRYGHFRFGRTAAMDDFFDRYESWLAGRDHTPALFREWAANHYTPGPASGTLTSPHEDTIVAAKPDAWAAIPITATNTSGEPWELRPGNYAGVHVQFTVHNDRGDIIHTGQAGLFRKTVPPKESLPLTLAVPPLGTPGLYTLRADLMNADEAAVPIRQTGFYQFGSFPLLLFLQVK